MLEGGNFSLSHEGEKGGSTNEIFRRKREKSSEVIEGERRPLEGKKRIVLGERPEFHRFFPGNGETLCQWGYC